MYQALRFDMALVGPQLEPKEDVWIVIKDGRISDLGTGAAPVGTKRHPAPVAMPGLVDAHVHLALSGGSNVEAEALAQNGATALSLLNTHAADHLRSGVTTVRDLGSPSNIVLKALARGDLALPHAPRVIGAGAVSSPDGHGNFLAAHAQTLQEYDAHIRAIIALGGRFLKLFATGGVITAGTVPNATQMDRALLIAVCERAHALGLRVAAHAHGDNGIANAIDAGVDTIEHFSYLQSHHLKCLAASGASLVSTIVATERFITSDERHSTTPETLAKIEVHAPHERHALRIAVEAHLQIAAGTDAGTTFNTHGFGMQEQALHFRDAGMDTRETLRSLTAHGATVLGVDSGFLAPGRYADILCLNADPLDDLVALSDINEVILAGSPCHK